jgi:VanZ family protein
LSVRRWAPALLWLAVILTATSIPNPAVPAVPGVDKAAHAIMYGVLAALVAYALSPSRRAHLWLVVAAPAIAAIAALDEWHQRFIPGRSASVGDWIADASGAGFALLVYGAVLGRRESAR